MPTPARRPIETIEIRVVESCGMAVALPARDVVAVVPLDGAQPPLERVGDLLVMRLGDRSRPILSLGQALCLEPSTADPAQEDIVVVVQVETQSFGLRVEAVSEPRAAIVLPTEKSAHGLAVFSNLVQHDNEVLFVLNPVRLALSAGDANGLGLSAAA
jgi:two-component system chemotaxis sensor kinase CheA